jgi:DNA-binding YbaB/EbfC family protein
VSFDVNRMMKQVKKMQDQMAKMQEEMEAKVVEATAGGGAVTVVASGARRVQSITISPEAADPAELEMLQDLLVAAVNEALRKAEAMASEEMAKLTGGLKIPGLL